MSEALQSGTDSVPTEVHSHPQRCDGSRTPPDVQYEIMRRHKQHMPLSVIGEQVGCDPRTVKAVIENWGNQLHRLRLEAHKAQLIDAVLLSWDESAKRGKSDSLRGWTDSLGITEPVKAQPLAQVAVQVNLHGGPEPVSLAKVSVESEGLQNQAQSHAGLITEPMITAEVLTNEGLSEGSIAHTRQAASAHEATVSQQDKQQNQATLCDSSRAGDKQNGL